MIENYLNLYKYNIIITIKYVYTVVQRFQTRVQQTEFKLAVKLFEFIK